MAKNFKSLQDASSKFFTSYQEQTKPEEVNQIPVEKKRPGRPKSKDLVRDNSAQRGLQKDYTRQTFIVRVDLLNKLKDYAYTERKNIKDILNDMIEGYLKDKHIIKRK
jgi:hypothetical protein